jgi:hypothetical protein
MGSHSPIDALNIQRQFDDRLDNFLPTIQLSFSMDWDEIRVRLEIGQNMDKIIHCYENHGLHVMKHGDVITGWVGVARGDSPPAMTVQASHTCFSGRGHSQLLQRFVDHCRQEEGVNNTSELTIGVAAHRR